MKSKLNSNVTGIVKITIFFTATIKDRFKIIIRNKKIWANLAEVCLYQFGDSNESASLKMKEQSFNKIQVYFERKLHFSVKLFWTSGVGDLLLVTKSQEQPKIRRTKRYLMIMVFCRHKASLHQQIVMIINRTIQLQFQVCCTPDCSGKLLPDTAGQLEFLGFFCRYKYTYITCANPSFLLLKYRELEKKKSGIHKEL